MGVSARVDLLHEVCDGWRDLLLGRARATARGPARPAWDRLNIHLRTQMATFLAAHTSWISLVCCRPKDPK